MSYTKRTDIDTTGPNFQPGESVVELADGSLVAVSCAQLRCTLSQCTVYAPKARWIDETGQTKADAQGHPVTTEHRHTTSAAEQTAYGADVPKACLMLVLGEPQPTCTRDGATAMVIPWDQTDAGQRVLSDCSIAQAIATAKKTFEPVAVGSLI